MKKSLYLMGILPILLICSIGSYAQNYTISGVVTDGITSEPLIGATVVYGPGKGVLTDFDGAYKLELPAGNYTIELSYVGYELVSKTIALKGNSTLNFKLNLKTLNEFKVIADLAVERETPVAFMNVKAAQISEELASRDIPMLLNSTPGVQATQQGGGDGDARITIRGFNQRNVAVMVDGVPVNDMENGWVYWSNWFGLDMVTQNLQVQRGLGASKIALPSVGGTLNIMTAGMENKMSAKIRQEYGTGNFLRTSIGYNSGRLRGDWGLTFAGSYKQGNGWVDHNFTQGFFYYLKVQKTIGNHNVSVSAFGAPQSHGQRSFKAPIAVWDKKLASEAGVSDSVIALNEEYGRKYNQHFGTYQKLTPGKIMGNQVTDTLFGETVEMNERVNYYHKPQFTVRDFWKINDQLYWSNIAYLSIGNGGGTGFNSSSNVQLLENGNMDFQDVWNANIFGGPFTPTSADLAIHPTEYKASNYIRSSVNNHFWYGYLSTATYKIDKLTELSFGADYRAYKGEHYREIFDLIGADYAVENSNTNDPNKVKRVGDKISYYDEGHVKWAGGFIQIEQKRALFSYFLSGSFVASGYKAVDYFRKKTIEINDSVYNIGWKDTLNIAGQVYHNQSEGVETYQTAWIWKPGITLKGGGNYNINDQLNAFVNLGYLSRTPRFNNVIDQNNDVIQSVKNELIKATELGVSYRSTLFSANLNAYYTIWNNRPVDNILRVADPSDPSEQISVNINGMNALHKGIELDFALKPLKSLTIEGMVSLGDWTWQSADSVQLFDDNSNPILNLNNTPYYVSYDAKGVHVGDAAQTQIGVSARYAIKKSAYIKLQGNYYDRYYSEFDPFSLSGVNAARESWQLPSYMLWNVFAGYTFHFDGFSIGLKGGVINVLDEVYISDAQNNDAFSSSFQDFDAKSAGVFVGQGRQFTISLDLQLKTK